MSDPNEIFLREVARRLPDADVVHIRHPPPPATSPPPELAAADAGQLAGDAVAQLVSLWERLFTELPQPDTIRLRWVAEHYPQALRAEASARLAGGSSRAVELAGDTERLAGEGWSLSSKEPSGGGVLIRGTRQDQRLNIVVATGDDAVLARVVTGEIVVGEFGKKLLAEGVRTVPWPGSPDGVS